MTNRIPLPGELWTVPAAGPDARVLVLSEPGVASSGAADFQGVGAHVLEGDRQAAHVDEIALAPAVLGGREAHAIELWNLRPLLLDQVGVCVGYIEDDDAFEVIWDAYLRMADPELEIDQSWFGVRVPSPTEIMRRHASLGVWHSLSSRGFVGPRRKNLWVNTADAGVFTAEDRAELSALLGVDAKHAVPVETGRAVVEAPVPAVAPMLELPAAQQKLRKGKQAREVKVFHGSTSAPITQVLNLVTARQSLVATSSGTMTVRGRVKTSKPTPQFRYA